MVGGKPVLCPRTHPVVMWRCARTGGWLALTSLLPIGSETDMPGSSFDAPVGNTWDVPVMPFVDMTMNRGSHTLSSYSKDTTIKGFALAFVGVREGSTTFAWAGDDTHYPTPKSFKTEISDFTAGGGVPVISFGGSKKILPEHNITDHAVLLSGYQGVINGYNVRHIDFDIEATVATKTVRERNVALMSDLLKSFTDLRISYSLEIISRGDEVGINPFGRKLLSDLAAKNIVPGLVNLLIEYLPAPLPPATRWDVAEKVMEAAQKQLTEIFKLTSQDAWGHIGACPMYAQTGDNVWTIDDHKKLREFADTHKIGCISGWNTNYDADHQYTYEKIQSGYQGSR